MISIIICSRTAEISAELHHNIHDSVGTDYEIIIIDNSNNIYSIFEAYNIGIKKSKGDYWCFMHDDIVFHTQDWGVQIHQIFETDSKIGLIGIAGSKIKTRMPSAWWDVPPDQKIICLIQHFSSKKAELWNVGWGKDTIEEVAVIDGVFMVGRKDENIKFDQRLGGFHNYDLNLSLEYKKGGYKIYVTRNILLEHLSLGKIDRSWYLSALKFDAYYGENLPVNVNNTISKAAFKKLEINNGIVFCINLVKYRLKLQSILYWRKLLWLDPFSKFNLYFIKLLLR